MTPHPPTADSEVTTAIADILAQHWAMYEDYPRYYRDEDLGCVKCWCGATHGRDRPPHPALVKWAEHVAAVLQASFVVVPKGQLHQETKLLDDGMGSVMTSPDGTVTSSWRPQTRMVRLVGPWRPA